jgi:hypothetical protein
VCWVHHGHGVIGNVSALGADVMGSSPIVLKVFWVVFDHFSPTLGD